MKTRRKTWTYGFRFNHVGMIAAAVILLLGSYNMAAAMEIPTDVEDLKVSLNTEIKYNYGLRVGSPDEAYTKSLNYGDGDVAFDRGTVTNRLDLLPELDVRYKDAYGFRISGSVWYDQRYRDALSTGDVTLSNNFENGVQTQGSLNSRTKDYYRGPYGEILDAFVYGKINIGDIPFNIKVGRHIQYWGEAWLSSGTSVAYAQFPIDVGKAYSVPGSSVKELFRPLFAATIQVPVTTQFSVTYQQFFQWEPFRLFEGGTYMAPIDFLFKGGNRLLTGPGAGLERDSDIEPDGEKNYGFTANWSPHWLDGARLGFYFRNFAEMQPTIMIDSGTGKYRFTYGDGVKLYGISFSKQMFTWTIGAEYSYRQNMPLNSGVAVGPAPLEGNILGARGNTHQALLNFFKIVESSPLYDTATVIAEFTYARLQKVTENEDQYLGRDGYNTLDKSTRDALGFGMSLTPTWFQVFPGVDINAPIAFSMGLLGTSPLPGGDAYRAGSGSLGVEFDFQTKYKVSLAYNKYFGSFNTGADGALTENRGTNALLTDRDYLSFTFKFNI